MSPKLMPDQDFLWEVLDYTASAGLLVWKHRPEWTFPHQEGRTPEHIANSWSAAWAGKPALASKAKNGYLRGCINGEMFYAHRIIYKMVHGVEPDDVDHDDGNRTNNRIGNLVNRTRTENMRNRALSSTNTSGVHGVSWSSRHKLWHASIYDKNQPKHLGWFKDFDAAVAVRKAAEKQLGYHTGHGRALTV